MHKVAILAHSHLTLFEMSCAIELFALPRPEFETWYKTDVVSLEQGEINTTGNISLNVTCISSLEAYDTLVIPGWPTWDFPIPAAIIHQVTRFVGSGKRVLTLCSGSFLLGTLGLLNGKKATTHWMYQQRFCQQFPHVDYQPDVLYLFDGNIGCSAGSADITVLFPDLVKSCFQYSLRGRNSNYLCYGLVGYCNLMRPLNIL